MNPPQTISLIFNEDVKPDLAAVAVTIDGASPVTLAVEQGAGTAQVVAAVPESTVARAVPNAEWTVRFRVTSADGHPIEGELGFTVKGWQAAGENSTVATPMASPSPSTAAPAAGEGGAGELAEVSSTSSGSTATSTVVIGGLAALGVAIATVLLVRARRRAVGSGE